MMNKFYNIRAEKPTPNNPIPKEMVLDEKLKKKPLQIPIIQQILIAFFIPCLSVTYPKKKVPNTPANKGIL